MLRVGNITYNQLLLLDVVHMKLVPQLLVAAVDTPVLHMLWANSCEVWTSCSVWVEGYLNV